MEVDIFIPCSVNHFAPQTGKNMIAVLESLNVKTNYNPQQSCCGQCFFNEGFFDQAKAMGEKFMKDFKDKNKIICPTTSCASFVRKYYKDLFHNTGLHLEYKNVQERIFEFTDYVVNHLKTDTIQSKFEGKVAYFHSCSAQKYELKNEPVTLLKNISGVELIEIADSQCCGFGGQFSLKYEPISVALASDKVNLALEAKAQYITSTDSTCLIHLDSYIKKQNLPIECIHIIDILAAK